jgi:hypothetical protein
MATFTFTIKLNESCRSVSTAVLTVGSLMFIAQLVVVYLVRETETKYITFYRKPKIITFLTKAFH